MTAIYQDTINPVLYSHFIANKDKSYIFDHEFRDYRKIYFLSHFDEKYSNFRFFRYLENAKTALNMINDSTSYYDSLGTEIKIDKLYIWEKKIESTISFKLLDTCEYCAAFLSEEKSKLIFNRSRTKSLTIQIS